MRRAGHERTAARPTTSCTPPGEPLRAVRVAAAEFERDALTFTGEAPEPAQAAKRRRRIEVAIRKRIESRLPGRVRDLKVCIAGDTVLLEGECSTYYTKQLAQHAALGILEDEHLENEIVVRVPR